MPFSQYANDYDRRSRRLLIGAASSKWEGLLRERGGMKVILVTGGTGLVGRALEEAVSRDPSPEERWIFLSSKDGDLRCDSYTLVLYTEPK